MSKAANLGQVATVGNVSYPRTGQVGASLGPDEEIALLDVTEAASYSDQLYNPQGPTPV